MSPIELRELRYLVAVADEGSFTRAATRCYVSQQAVSSALAQLERRLGTALVVRRPRGCSTTPAGARLVAAARRILDAADELVDVVDPRPYADDVLHVGLLLDGLGERTWPLIQGFRAAHPEVRVAVGRIQPHEVPAALLDGAVDVALLHGPCDDERLVVTPLFSEPRLVVVSAAASPADARHLLTADVLDLPARPRRDGIDPGWEGFFTLISERNGTEPERRGEPAGSLKELLWAISLEQLFLTVPDHLATTYPGRLYGVAYVPVPDLPEVVFSAVRRRDDDRAAVRGFVDLAVVVGRDGVGAEPADRRPA
ncbi:LysR family transcriptional regulator [Nocardioides sp. GXQ0305]|uniref:LysR family transcriptional regulator n=1 Tax=Nocardioides sp. GXQ0305 TaxID=3423912 RepID=UPI003D7CDA90